jgi:hypothetical protein
MEMLSLALVNAEAVSFLQYKDRCHCIEICAQLVESECLSKEDAHVRVRVPKLLRPTTLVHIKSS